VIIGQSGKNLGRAQVVPFRQNFFRGHTGFIIVSDNVPYRDARVFDDGFSAADAFCFDDMRIRRILGFIGIIFHSVNSSSFVL